MGEWGGSRNFTITAGVKQGCVLSPRLFSATLEWALRGWKNASQRAGIDLRDGLPNLMELRFADDILLFVNSGPEVAQHLEKLIVAVGCAGLILNAEKSVLLTSQAQPPPTLVIRDDVVVKVLDRNRGQKWLRCMLTAAGSRVRVRACWPEGSPFRAQAKAI